MENWLFTPEHIDVLLHPERWKLVTLGQPEPAQGRLPAGMRHWYAAHLQRHAHREVLVCLAGHGFYGLGDDLYRTSPGVVMVFGPMELHQGGYPRFLPPQEHLWISMLPDQFTARVLTIRGGRTKAHAATSVLFDADDVAFRITDRTLGTGAGTTPPAEARRARLFAAVAAMTATLLHRGCLPPPVTRTRLADPERVMASLMEHLRETAGRGDSLSSLARIAGYSQFHFLRLFKRITGHTVHHYVDQCRRQKVRQLLDANWSKTAISAELGFSTPQSFSRWFRHARGTEQG